MCNAGTYDLQRYKGYICCFNGFRHMKSLSTAIDDKTQIAFNEDGTVKDTELNILNLDQTSQWQVVRTNRTNTLQYPSRHALRHKKEDTATYVAHFSCFSLQRVRKLGCSDLHRLVNV